MYSSLDTICVGTGEGNEQVSAGSSARNYRSVRSFISASQGAPSPHTIARRHSWGGWYPDGRDSSQPKRLPAGNRRLAADRERRQALRGITRAMAQPAAIPAVRNSSVRPHPPRRSARIDRFWSGWRSPDAMPAMTSGSVSCVVAVEVGAKPALASLIILLPAFAAAEVNGARAKRFASRKKLVLRLTAATPARIASRDACRRLGDSDAGLEAGNGGAGLDRRRRRCGGSRAARGDAPGDAIRSRRGDRYGDDRRQRARGARQDRPQAPAGRTARVSRA